MNALSKRQFLKLSLASGVALSLSACGGGDDDGPREAHKRVQTLAQGLVKQGVVGAAAGWADPRQVRTAVAGLRRLGGNAPLATGDLMTIGNVGDRALAGERRRIPVRVGWPLCVQQ